MTDRFIGSNDSRFVGKVVNVLDPKKQGRVQVRVFGLHDDAVKIPDRDLPWAMPIIPITHGASFQGKGQAPVGVVPGTVVVGYFLDSDKTMLRLEGSVPSAGRTKAGKLVNGSYELDDELHDVPHASRGMDLNAALGLKNLPAISQRGSSYSTVSAGIGHMATTTPGILSHLIANDPKNLSGAMNFAVMGMSKILFINSLTSEDGNISTAAVALQRVMATAMMIHGVSTTIRNVNSIGSLIAPSALVATNMAMSSLSDIARTDGQAGLGNASLSAVYVNSRMNGFTPRTSPGIVANAQQYYNPKNDGIYASRYTPSELNSLSEFTDQVNSVGSVSQLTTLGGVDTIYDTAGAPVMATAALTDIAASSAIGMLYSSLNPSLMAAAISSLMNLSSAGGINLVFGMLSSTLNSSVLGSVGGVIMNATSLLSGVSVSGSIIGNLLNNATHSLALAKKKEQIANLASAPEAPKEPETTTKTVSTAVVKAAAETTKPSVGNLDETMYEPELVTIPMTSLEDVVPKTADAVENSDIMSQLLNRQSTQSEAAASSRDTFENRLSPKQRALLARQEKANG
jgi:hypothetical protein